MCSPGSSRHLPQGTVTTQLSPMFRLVVGSDISSEMYLSAPLVENVKVRRLLSGHHAKLDSD
jgi:hypothetical protein